MTGRWPPSVVPLSRTASPQPLTLELRIERQAVNRLNVWFAKPLSKAEILERIRSDQTISEPVRKQALALAERSASSLVRLRLEDGHSSVEFFWRLSFGRLSHPRRVLESNGDEW